MLCTFFLSCETFIEASFSFAFIFFPAKNPKIPLKPESPFLLASAFLISFVSSGFKQYLLNLGSIYSVLYISSPFFRFLRSDKAIICNSFSLYCSSTMAKLFKYSSGVFRLLKCVYIFISSLLSTCASPLEIATFPLTAGLLFKYSLASFLFLGSFINPQSGTIFLSSPINKLYTPILNSLPINASFFVLPSEHIKMIVESSISSVMTSILFVIIWSIASTTFL